MFFNYGGILYFSDYQLPWPEIKRIRKHNVLVAKSPGSAEVNVQLDLSVDGSLSNSHVFSLQKHIGESANIFAKWQNTCCGCVRLRTYRATVRCCFPVMEAAISAEGEAHKTSVRMIFQHTQKDPVCCE